MKVGIIVPHRNDRPAFLERCKRFIDEQTLQPEIVLFVDYAPKSAEKDITERYRFGYDQLRNRGLDIIAFIEVDDWYSPNYLQTMVDAWKEAGQPELFGTRYTIYYNIRLRAWFRMDHPHRACAMNTLIKPNLDISWCPDHEPYTDQHLWMVLAKTGKLQGVTFTPTQHIALGIKHGIGLNGGHHHNSRLERYVNPDAELSWLKSVVGEEDAGFYASISFSA